MAAQESQRFIFQHLFRIGYSWLYYLHRLTHTSFKGCFDYGRGWLRQGYQSDGDTGPPTADHLLSLEI